MDDNTESLGNPADAARLRATIEGLALDNATLRERVEALERDGKRAARERDRLAAILDHMGEAVLALDVDGAVVSTNAAWDRMLGPPHDLDPRDDLGRPLPREAWAFSRIVHDDPFSFDFSVQVDNGPRRWFEAVACPMTDEGRAAGGLLVVRDITDRSLRRLQERFLAVASHELRTPMTTLSGSIQLIERRMRGQQPPSLQPFITRARDQLRRLELIIADLTDGARLRGGLLRLDIAPADLVEVARDAVEVAGNLPGHVPVALDAPSEPLRVAIDAPRIEQVLLNLNTND
jgi:two-component system CheB/CheR fusion protein